MAGSPPCGKEALALLNCVADKAYDESRCAALLSVLRKCVERRVVCPCSYARYVDCKQNVKSFAIDTESKKEEKEEKASENKSDS